MAADGLVSNALLTARVMVRGAHVCRLVNDGLRPHGGVRPHGGMRPRDGVLGMTASRDVRYGVMDEALMRRRVRRVMRGDLPAAPVGSCPTPDGATARLGHRDMLTAMRHDDGNRSRRRLWRTSCLRRAIGLLHIKRAALGLGSRPA